ncbi:VCBS repeat-containing protein [Zunongwangia sp. F363]|uniref:VCBS repeat-containing protein n=1 Tax=Autumnicola tepida TaxID=3075595 RepID=A0ABU3CA83_9FLAO|nr:VCBS repeat-containing protein [Zunongwangia sp. F363]MDT0643247.1 VCBS repeat-containing protein [Zunongwangia sp. F363]
MRKFSILFLLILGCFSCSEEIPEEKQQKLFTTLGPEATNLNFTNQLTETDALNILDYLYFYNGGGVAIGDINNDDLPDIYLTGNQVKNKLFLNKGSMKFEDITENAGVGGNSDWNTGVVMADVNGDGLLDIYVCAVVGVNGLRGKNELYINNGNTTFIEMAEDYGLDFKNYSSSAAFFDYDNDGDLDMFLLNHAVHTINTYGPADIRNKRTEESGDKLLKNENGKFTDVSEEAGIYGGANGYGLGLATADFNNDGFTDIYVSNDFHEDDYYYINNGDGTFTEDLKGKFGHVSRFSMGNDVADVNRDGFLDILTLDMLPEDEKVLKASVGDDPVDLDRMKVNRLNYHNQYSRNMLQLNQAGEYFQEIGLFSGLAATDWSWSPLFGDYDQDGIQDVFITTGIPKRPNDLDYIKYVSSEQIQKKINATNLVDQKALDKMPSGAVPNYIFKGAPDLHFERYENWISTDSIISTGAAYGDLDNDGDLDIVTNNINEPVSVYENKTDSLANFLKLKLRFHAPNIYGIGTKVISYNNGKQQVKQLFTSRGFQSSSEPILHFGYGENRKIDSLLIIWPDNTFQIIKDVATNQALEIFASENRDTINYQKLFPRKKKWFEKIDSLPGLDYVHEENPYTDFDRQKLIPYQISDRGPAVAVKDFNQDGKEDIFFGSSKFQPARVYLQKNASYEATVFPTIAKDSITEDVSAAVADFNGDGLQDLFVASSGGEFSGKNEALLDRLYISTGKDFNKQELPPYFENSSVVAVADYDGDGDNDVFVGGHAVSSDFGKIPNSYILKNEDGNFSIVHNKELQNIGMVTDAIWDDFDNDGREDLILVGEWMSPKFFRNEDGRLKDRTARFISEKLNGLWQRIIPFDINNDGKMDYLLGNWGLNTKLNASADFPLKLYYNDFDNNGSTETILSYSKNGKYYTLNGLDELVGQLSFLRKKFPAYKDFAGKTVDEIFDRKELEKAELLTVNTLASGYLLNQQGKFKFEKFEAPLQVAPLMCFLKADFNRDGKEEIFAAGNYFGITPYHGRFDGLAGNIITSTGHTIEAKDLGVDLTQKSVRSLDVINFNGKDYLMVTVNNDKPLLYTISE